LRHTTSSSTTGSAIAVSFSQYWNACTNVIERMPPATTPATTTTATTSAPTHGGTPVTVSSARPAAWNCGSRYSQPMPSTSSDAARRTTGDRSRISAKSGSV
jgi:hypothetical protein